MNLVFPEKWVWCEGVLDLPRDGMKPPVSAAAAFDHDGSVLIYIAGYTASKIVGKFSQWRCKEC